jgi:hypothetical protein
MSQDILTRQMLNMRNIHMAAGHAIIGGPGVSTGGAIIAGGLSIVGAFIVARFTEGPITAARSIGIAGSDITDDMMQGPHALLGKR